MGRAPTVRGVSRCGWTGCTRTESGDELPQDWRHVLVFMTERNRPGFLPHMNPNYILERLGGQHVLLCPEHARALDGLIGGPAEPGPGGDSDPGRFQEPRRAIRL
jgi:hypothetical protein